MSNLKDTAIAKVAHEINRAFCLAMGDNSQPTWEDAPDWQKNSAIAGVKIHMLNPDLTPQESHAAWLEHKIKDGWVYGPEKDSEKKTHPCVIAYEDLPLEQKAKDYLFKQVIHSLKELEV